MSLKLQEANMDRIWQCHRSGPPTVQRHFFGNSNLVHSVPAKRQRNRDMNAWRRQSLRRACKRGKRKPAHLVRHRNAGKRVGFEDHAMTTPRPEEGGSGKGTPGDSRRPAAAWVKACRHLPVFEKLGEWHMLPIIFATKESMSYTWKRRGSWGPASPIHAVGGCTGHAVRQTSQTKVAHAGANL